MHWSETQLSDKTVATTLLAASLPHILMIVHKVHAAQQYIAIIISIHHLFRTALIGRYVMCDTVIREANELWPGTARFYSLFGFS